MSVLVFVFFFFAKIFLDSDNKKTYMTQRYTLTSKCSKEKMKSDHQWNLRGQDVGLIVISTIITLLILGSNIIIYSAHQIGSSLGVYWLWNFLCLFLKRVCLFVYLLTYFFIWKAELPREVFYPLVYLSNDYIVHCWVRAEARNPELHPGLPHDWQG